VNEELTVPSSTPASSELAETTPIPGGKILIPVAIDIINVRDTIPTIVTSSPTPRFASEAIQIQIMDQFHIESFSYGASSNGRVSNMSFPEALVNLVFKLYKHFEGYYVSPSTTVNMIHGSSDMAEGAINRPWRIFNLRDSDTIDFVNGKLKSSEFTGSESVIDRYGIAAKQLNKFEVDMFYADHVLFSICQGTQASLFLTDPALLQAWLQSFPFSHFMSVPYVREPNQYIPLDTVTEYYERIMVNSHKVADTVYDFVNGYVQRMVETSTFATNLVFTDMLRLLNVRTTVFSEENVTPTRLVSGAARSAVVKLLSVLAMNRVYRLHIDIPDIEKYDVTHLMTVFVAVLMIPFSALPSADWALLFNYANNHLIYPLARRRSRDGVRRNADLARVSNADRYSPSPLFDNLLLIRGNGAGELRDSLTQFFGSIGPGLMDTPVEVCPGITAVNVYTSRRYSVSSGNNPMAPGRRFHSFAWRSVRITSDSSYVPEEFTKFDHLVDLNSALDHTGFNVIGDIVKRNRNEPGAIQLLLSSMALRREHFLSYVEMMNRAVDRIEFMPVCCPILDTEMSENRLIDISISDILSFAYIMDWTGLRIRMSDFTTYGQGMALIHSLNQVGRHISAYYTLFRDHAMDSFPTNVGQDIPGYQRNFISSSAVMEKAMAHFSPASPLEGTFKDIMMQEGNWNVYRDFPARESWTNELIEILDFVKLYPHRFGVGTEFVNMPTRFVNSSIAGGRAYRITNVSDLARELEDPQILLMDYDSVANRYYTPDRFIATLGKIIHLRPYKLIKGRLALPTTSELNDILVYRQGIKLAVWATDAQDQVNADMVRYESVEELRFCPTQFPFIEVDSYRPLYEGEFGPLLALSRSLRLPLNVVLVGLPETQLIG
jgi:hypothetical protein